MGKRRFRSIKDELLKKSREAMLAAVQIYNNPQITFKSESFISLAVISWTYMLHAYYKSQKIEYRYFRNQGNKRVFDKTKHGANKHWELERCLNDDNCPLDNDTIANLRFLIGIRHEIEHQMTDRIDEYLSAKLQACAINFDYYIVTLFGQKYNISNELALAIQFSPISPAQEEYLSSSNHITTNVRNFVTEFEDNLSDESIRSARYAYRILFVPINTNRKGQADQVIEFIKADSPLAQDIEKSYAVIKETEKKKYLPGEIVALMIDKGHTWFTINKHTDLWKAKDAKNPQYHFGTLIAKTWYWYESWVTIVEQYCRSQYTDNN